MISIRVVGSSCWIAVRYFHYFTIPWRLSLEFEFFLLHSSSQKRSISLMKQ